MTSAPRFALLVAAAKEAISLGRLGLPLIETGIGPDCVNDRVRAEIAALPAGTVLLNVGTAGGLRDGVAGHSVIGSARDLTAPDTPPVALPTPGIGAPVRTLGTYDRFVQDDALRAEFAATCELVDMECVWLAALCADLGRTMIAIKTVSDTATEGALDVWEDVASAASSDLGAFVADALPTLERELA